MQVEETSLPGVFILSPKVFGDARGFFMESFNQKAFEEATGCKREFVQDNYSRSRQGCYVASITSLSSRKVSWCALPRAACGMWR